MQGCGRTDAGVHALAQVAHVDLEKSVHATTVCDALNFYMRHKPVCVLDAQEVSPDFHARFSALERRYLYRVNSRHAPLALEVGRVVHVPRALDLVAMQRSATCLIGQHDFSTFRAADCQAKSPIKTLDAAVIEQAGDEFRFHFTARSFLYHQVRNMVGSLLHVGSGKWSAADFEKAFAARNRAAGGPTAPAHGLYFVGVRYP